MNRLVSATSAATLAVSLALSAAVMPAFAQMQTAEEVMDGMAKLGMNVENLTLTEEQVLQIEGILNGSDEESEKVAAIKELLGN